MTHIPHHHHASRDLPGRTQSAAQGRVITVLVLIAIVLTMVGGYFWYG